MSNMFVKSILGIIYYPCQKLNAVIVCKINSDLQMLERHGNQYDK